MLNYKKPKDVRPGDTIGMIHGAAIGAIPNGTRVVKIQTEPGDAHPIGARGVVMSSVGPAMYKGRMTIGYFIAWDDVPDLPVFIIDSKINSESQA